MEESKNCPFSQRKCSSDCGLFINPKDLNETVKNKLASVGVIDRNSGLCAIKNMSLCLSRYIFEKNINNYK